MQLDGKRVVVTGASQGLGRELCKTLLESGAHVIAVARSEEKLVDFKNQLKACKENFTYVVCDITDEDQIVKAEEEIKSNGAHIDILINNAGVWTDLALEELDSALRKKAFDTNALGNINFTYGMLPLLAKAKHARVMNVISVAGNEYGKSGEWAVYNATKWAMHGFSQSLRLLLATRHPNIHVSDFFPGGFESNLYENVKRVNPHDQPWMMKTPDVAECVMFMITRPEDMNIEEMTVTKVM